MRLHSGDPVHHRVGVLAQSLSQVCAKRSELEGKAMVHLHWLRGLLHRHRVVLRLLRNLRLRHRLVRLRSGRRLGCRIRGLGAFYRLRARYLLIDRRLRIDCIIAAERENIGAAADPLDVAVVFEKDQRRDRLAAWIADQLDNFDVAGAVDDQQHHAQVGRQRFVAMSERFLTFGGFLEEGNPVLMSYLADVSVSRHSAGVFGLLWTESDTVRITQ